MEMLDGKHIEPAQSSSSCNGLWGRAVDALAYGNEWRTDRPDEMDFPFVDTTDCVVTVGFSECGLITYKDLCSVEW